MAGGRDDVAPGHLTGSPARGVEAPARRGGGLRAVGLAVGLLLAIAGTVAVFATDDARYLRIALLATCWAFLVAAFLAGGRRADQVAARSREVELQQAYDLELEREVSARKAHELELERRLRRESEEGMRRELAGLRNDLAGLSGLRTDLAALGELRADLGRLRSELTEQLSGELLIERMVMRAQSVRLPADRSAEDARTVDVAAPADPPLSASWEQHTTVERWPERREEPVGGRALAAPVPPVPPVAAVAAPHPVPAASWSVPSPVPRASRPAPPPITTTRRLTRIEDDVPAESPRPGPRWEPASPGPSVSPPSSPALEVLPPALPEPAPSPAPAEPVRAEPVRAENVRTDGPRPSPAPSADRPTPAPRNRYRVGLDTPPGPDGDGAAPRRHRRAAETDEHRLPAGAPRAAAHGPAEPAPVAPTPTEPDPPVHAPAWSWEPDAAAPEPAPAAPEPAPAAPEPAPAAPEPAPAVPAEAHASGHARLEQILADSGVSPAPGRRRRRYRDEDDQQPPDDVLARVLGR